MGSFVGNLGSFISMSTLQTDSQLAFALLKRIILVRLNSLVVHNCIHDLIHSVLFKERVQLF